MGLQKKLDKARQEGFIEGMQAGQNQIQEVWLDGIRVGAEAANEAWVTAIQNTKGIGPKLMERIMEEAKRQHDERVAKRNQEMEAMKYDRSGTERQDPSQQADKRRIG